MPGGPWTLSAVPSGGWSVTPGAVWPIRLLTLLSVGLVAFPMLRTRALVLERHAHVAHLRSRETELQRLSQRLGLALDASRVGVWDFNIDTERADLGRPDGRALRSARRRPRPNLRRLAVASASR